MLTITHLIYLLLQASPEPIVVQQAANWTSVITAFIVALPATIAAVFGGMAVMQSRRNAEVAAKTDAKVDVTDAKADTIITKATEIHTLTNSNLSQVQARLDVSNKTIENLNLTQVESARRMADMEQLIRSLIPAKGESNPSQTNSNKLDTLTAMVSDVQQGKPPIPVTDEAVLAKLNEVVIKQDTLQEDVTAAKDKTADS